MEERKNLATNRRAFHEFTVDDRVECGIELKGTEVKSMRERRFNFSDSYGRIRNGQLELVGLHITPYSHGNIFNHDPDRVRRLLAHRDEIERFRKRVDERGYTLVPLAFYLKQGLIKLDLGLCKGKKLHDKREDLKRKAMERDADREMGRGH